MGRNETLISAHLTVAALAELLHLSFFLPAYTCSIEDDGRLVLQLMLWHADLYFIGGCQHLLEIYGNGKPDECNQVLINGRKD